jgi:hypothetical protein
MHARVYALLNAGAWLACQCSMRYALSHGLCATSLLPLSHTPFSAHTRLRVCTHSHHRAPSSPQSLAHTTLCAHPQMIAVQLLYYLSLAIIIHLVAVGADTPLSLSLVFGDNALKRWQVKTAYLLASPVSEGGHAMSLCALGGNAARLITSHWFLCVGRCVCVCVCVCVCECVRVHVCV